MNKKTNPISLLVMIVVLGLAVSVIGGDFNIGGYFEDLDTDNIEVLLEYLSIGLAFLTLGGLTLYLILRGSGIWKDPIGFEGWVENLDDQDFDD